MAVRIKYRRSAGSLCRCFLHPASALGRTGRGAPCRGCGQVFGSGHFQWLRQGPGSSQSKKDSPHPSKKWDTMVVPLARAPSIILRWEIDLSPGTVISPLNRRTGFMIMLSFLSSNGAAEAFSAAGVNFFRKRYSGTFLNGSQLFGPHLLHKIQCAGRLPEIPGYGQCRYF